MRLATVLLAVGAWLIGGCGCGDKKTEFETALTVQSLLPTAIDIFNLEFQRRPPMTVAELARFPRWAGLSVARNTTNECNECLLMALHHPDLLRSLDQLPGKTPFGNTDGDSWSGTPSGFPSEKASEILDGWGNPIVYIRSDAYGRVVTIVTRDGKSVEAHAVRRQSGGYYNAESYQLISLGEDGVQSEDDVENFIRMEE